MQNKFFLVGYKLFFSFLGLSALITEIVVGSQRGLLVPANFFSYFTVESNILAALVLLMSAFAVLKKSRNSELMLLRGAATLYIVTTGIVFGALLSGYDSTQLTFVPWDNIVLHYIIPIAVLADWLMDPPTYSLRFRDVLAWLLYPVVYLAYSLVRGPIAEWYPYPFLDPTQQHGYAGVAMTAFIIALTVLILMWLLIRVTVTGKKGRK